MRRTSLGTIPNLLSLLRVALALPILLAVRSGSPLLAAALFLLASATDALDGWLARRLGALTTSGRLLDPIADKILAAATAFALWRWRGLPAWFLGAVLLRDLLLLAGGALLARKTGEVPVSNIAGKTAFGLLAAVLFVYLAGLRSLYAPALAAGSAGLVVSFVSYASALVPRRVAGPSDRDKP